MITLAGRSPLAPRARPASAADRSARPPRPAGGCRVAAAMPVIAHSVSASDQSSSSQPWVQLAGAAGWTPVRPGQRGRVVAELRVVLHGARPERIGAQVDRVLAVGQPGDVGDQVTLGHLGERDRLVPQPPGRAPAPRPPTRGRRWCGTTRPRRPGLEQLEDGRLAVAAHERGARAARPPARPGRGASRPSSRTTFSRADTKASISSRVRRSVTATSSRGPRSPGADHSRRRGRPARRPGTPRRPSGRRPSPGGPAAARANSRRVGAGDQRLDPGYGEQRLPGVAGRPGRSAGPAPAGRWCRATTAGSCTPRR